MGEVRPHHHGAALWDRLDVSQVMTRTANQEGPIGVFVFRISMYFKKLRILDFSTFQVFLERDTSNKYTNKRLLNRYRDRSSNSNRSTAKTVISISISYVCDFSISTVLEGISDFNKPPIGPSGMLEGCVVDIRFKN